MSDNRAMALYERVDNPIAFIEAMAESNAIMIPGCDLKAGRALTVMLMRRGMDAMDFIQRYHIIKGKPTMRADAMLAEFRINKGGRHKILQRTSDISEATFITSDGDEYTFKLTWEEVQQERYCWAKECGPGTSKTQPTFENLKDNWATPQGRKQMMWARLCSDSIRAICPEINAGIYTPEEAMDFDENQESAVTSSPVKKMTASKIVEAAAVAPEATSTTETQRPSDPSHCAVDQADGNVEDADYEMQGGLEPHEPGSAIPPQLARLNHVGEAFYGEKWPETLTKALTARNCSVDKNLSIEQANDLIGKIESLIREKKAAEGKN